MRYFDDEHERRRIGSHLQKRRHSQGPYFSWEAQPYPRHVYDSFKAPRSFRVLQSFACNLQTCQIFAVFHQFSLDEHSALYEALSYTWGQAWQKYAISRIDSNRCQNRKVSNRIGSESILSEPPRPPPLAPQTTISL